MLIRQKLRPATQQATVFILTQSIFVTKPIPLPRFLRITLTSTRTATKIEGKILFENFSSFLMKSLHLIARSALSAWALGQWEP